MKKLIMIALALTLALGIVWLPSVAANGPYPIEIHKTIPAGGPEETFTFWGYRDMNNNGVFDAGDIDLGTVEITGAGTCYLNSPVIGVCIVCEELIEGSAYKEQPCQTAEPGCVPITFANELKEEEKGKLIIYKVDEEAEPLAGACFDLTPDPRTCEGSLELCDNDDNDECDADGVLCLSGLQVCCEFYVTETVAPDGYDLDPTPYPVHVTEPGQVVTLTIVNTVVQQGSIKILKTDPDGLALAGSTFEISPNPQTCEPPALTVVDEGLNDEAIGEPGVMLVSGCMVCCECTVTEIEAPEGYELDPTPQPAHVTEAGETVTLTFVNTPPELSCGTVCAAQTAPGEFLFSTRQKNWFTWIYYGIGWGSEDYPYTYPIYTGQTTLCGTLYVYDNGTHIFVNYVLTDTSCTLGGLSEYHLQVDESFDDLYGAVVKGKNPVPGKAEYSGSFDPMVSETDYIEAVDDDVSEWTTAYIFAHGIGCYYCS